MTTTTTTESAQAGGERAAFEAHAARVGWDLTRSGNGFNDTTAAVGAWMGWQARAALSAPPAPASRNEAVAQCPTCKAPCTTKVNMRGGDHGWGTSDAERTVYRYAAPESTPVAAVAQPVADEVVREAFRQYDWDLRGAKNQSPWQLWRDGAYWAARALAASPSCEQSADAYRVFEDGDQWCAVGPSFVDLQESLAAFADTPYLALERLREAEGEQKRYEAIRAAIQPTEEKAK